MIRERKYRHLPVNVGKATVGLVWVRDLYAAYNTSLEQDMNDLNAANCGENCGTALSISQRSGLPLAVGNATKSWATRLLHNLPLENALP